MSTSDATSTLTQRYQTTVPEPVRRALRLRKHDTLRYRVEGDRVYLERAEEADPALGPFLDLLARDIATHPERLAGVPAALRARAEALTAGVEVDLDAALPDE